VKSGESRGEGPVLHFEFRHSNSENRERVEGGEATGQFQSIGHCPMQSMELSPVEKKDLP